MPRPSALKVISRPGTETLYIRGTVSGVTIFRSAGTNNRRLAEEKRAALEAELFREAVHGPAPTKRHVPGFGQAVQEYLDAGKQSAPTQRLLLRLLDHFGDTPCDEIDQLALEAAYKTVLRAGTTASSKKRLVLCAVLLSARVPVTRNACRH